jgi:hypothetical protein
MRVCACARLRPSPKRPVERHLLIVVLCAVAQGCGGQKEMDHDNSTSTRNQILDFGARLEGCGDEENTLLR